MPGYSIDRDNYLKRLRLIEGQVRGLARMIEDDKYCIDVLTQNSSVTSALRSVGLGLLGRRARGRTPPRQQGGSRAGPNRPRPTRRASSELRARRRRGRIRSGRRKNPRGSRCHRPPSSDMNRLVGHAVVVPENIDAIRALAGRLDVITTSFLPATTAVRACHAEFGAVGLKGTEEPAAEEARS